MISRIFVVVLAAQLCCGQQQLQAYLAQQQAAQHQQQQYRLIPGLAQQQQQRLQQQYATEDEEAQPQPQQQYRLAAAPQPQYLQYRQPQPQQQAHRLRPTAEQAEPLEQQPEDYDPNPQYQFGFDVKDDQFTNYQNRKEQREGDKITGSYSVVDSDGFIRTVTYTADPKEGFKAEVTRTPTDIVVKLPQPPAQQLQEVHGLQRQLSARQPQRLEQQHHQQQQQQQPQQYLRQSAPAAPAQGQYVQLSPAQLQQYVLQRQQHEGAQGGAQGHATRYTAQPQPQQAYAQYRQ